MQFAHAKSDMKRGLRARYLYRSPQAAHAHGGRSVHARVPSHRCRKSLKWEVVAHVLTAIFKASGLPYAIKSANGRELISKVVDKWANVRGVEFELSRSGKQPDNANIASFIGRLTQLPHATWFMLLDNARGNTKAWRHHYNKYCSLCALDCATTEEFVRRC